MEKNNTQNKQVPILITWDVDPDRWTTLENRQRALSMALDLCEEFSIRSTFFITANFAHEYPAQIERMRELKQEIGCHGLNHSDEEDYNRMPEDMQRSFIKEATQKLEAAAGGPIFSFRSPRVKTSAHTLRLLAECGYRADSSVCSQRVDFVSSNLINPGWIFAPRRPYHPHNTSAFKRGDIPIWEIPVSALVLPFISNLLTVFGVRLMKIFFRLLRAESRYTSKPIVYLAHPTEFILKKSPTSKKWKSRFRLKELSPSYIKTHGLLLRKMLYRMDSEAWFNATRELFAYMASWPDTVFMTSSEYANYLTEHAGTTTQEKPLQNDYQTSNQT
jgi:predicted deacetylase